MISKKIKKSQGEIFGIALMFVVIIIGIIVYAKIKANNPDSQKDLVKELKYKILAESTLDSILKQSTSCSPERNKDRIIDLIEYCLYNSQSSGGADITCKDSIGPIESCQKVIYILNESLFSMYNNSNGLNIPFLMSISLPANKDTILSDVTITNFGEFAHKNKKITINNRRKYGYNKAPSGLYSIPTSQRNIDFELALYYK